jgi:hypothetical protein
MNRNAASVLEVHAAVVLLVCDALSLAYELWRAFGRRGASRFDSPRAFVTQVLALYVMAAIVVALLLAGVPGAAWIGLVFTVVFILVSILYYNPVVLLERSGGAPSVVDHAENLAYTGLLFVAAALLFYELLGRSLS